MAGNPLTEAAPRPVGTSRSGWTAGRVIALAAGSLPLLVSFALLAGSGTLIWADQFRAGYLTPALSWLATEMLAAGLLLGVAAVVLIIVPVRLAGRPGPPSPGSAPAA